MKERNTYNYNPLDLEIDRAIGIKLPIMDDNSNFILSYTSEEQAITNLKNLLLTGKGERIMLPDFGTLIREKLFENINDDVIDDLRDDVSQAIAFWTPYINVLDLRIYTRVLDLSNNYYETNNTIFIDITFSVSPYNNEFTIRVFNQGTTLGITEEN